MAPFLKKSIAMAFLRVDKAKIGTLLKFKSMDKWCQARLCQRCSTSEENAMRYVPHTKEEIKAMLEAVGLRNVDELFSDIPPRHCSKDIFKLKVAGTKNSLGHILEKLQAVFQMQTVLFTF